MPQVVPCRAMSSWRRRSPSCSGCWRRLDVPQAPVGAVLQGGTFRETRPARGARRARAMAATAIAWPRPGRTASSTSRRCWCARLRRSDRAGVRRRSMADRVARAPPMTTLFKVHVRRCGSCARRVQGRHPEQTSDALYRRRSVIVRMSPTASSSSTVLKHTVTTDSATLLRWPRPSPPPAPNPRLSRSHAPFRTDMATSHAQHFRRRLVGLRASAFVHLSSGGRPRRHRAEGSGGGRPA